MHTVFYVDIYLTLNFIMNFFLLILTAIIRQKRGIGGRIFLCSLFFAGISTGCTWLFWDRSILRAASACLELGGMIFFAFRPESGKLWWREMGTFLSLALFAGGGMTAFLSMGNAIFAELPVSSTGMLCVSVVLMGISFGLLRGQWRAQRDNSQTVVWVELFHRGRRCSAKALVDTGNRLVSPYTGEGVWILSEELAASLELSRENHPLYIPFQSLGGDGLWEAYRLDRVVVEGEKNYEKVLVAVSPHLGEMDEIQMILNIMWS